MTPSTIAELPVAAIADRLLLGEREAADVVEAMGRLGIVTLGALAALTPAQVADRFGSPGLRALCLARGEEDLLVVHHRGGREEVAAEIELPEGTEGERLERALELLVERLLADPLRRERTLLGVRLAARLGDGEHWAVDQGLGRPTAAAGTLRTVLAPRLHELPAPAASLRLRSLGLGPRAADQMELGAPGEESRRHRLLAALREVRAAQGGDSLLRVLPIDEASRVPERRALLAPFPVR